MQSLRTTQTYVLTPILRRVALAAVLVGLAACSDTAEFDKPSTLSAALTDNEASCFLSLVNDCRYTTDFFDTDLKWDRRSAEALTDLRNGPDGQCATRDDRPITQMETLDALPWVGTVALAHLRAHLERVGCLNAPQTCDDTPVVISTVRFTRAQVGDALDFLRRARPAELERIDGIGPVLAARIIQRRHAYEPLTVDAIRTIDGVGPQVLLALRESLAELWCSTPRGRCGCPDPTENRLDWLTEALSDPDVANDFLRLLGDKAYPRVVVAQAPALLERSPDDPDPRVTLAWVLSDRHFAMPHRLGSAPAAPNTEAAAIEAGIGATAVSAAIAALGEQTLDDTSVGTPLLLLATFAREAYLNDIEAWRAEDPTAVTIESAGPAWLVSGSILSIPTTVSISKSSRDAFVEFELD
ncbi:MAG: hypothetical protein ACI9OJ_005298 [Myxococcota bacterium]|jgi:hypothetical protein